jgi:hypothetical protein
MCKGDNLNRCLIIGVAVFFLLFVVSLCSAGELVAARPDTFVVGGTSGIMKIQTNVHTTTNGVRSSDLPDAYLLYSGDGAKFWLTRYDAAASAYGGNTPIPANSSLTIPAPPAFRLIDGNGEYRYYHYFFIGAAAVTDSVFIIPLDR